MASGRREADELRARVAALEAELATVREAHLQAEAELIALRSGAAMPSPPVARPRSPRGRARRRVRVLPPLPAGVFDGTAEAHRHMVTSRDAALVVDGYNLARARWSGLTPEEERRRTVALLEGVAARSKAPVYVVFDGDGTTVGPAHSRSVRVLFPSSGSSADDEIARFVRALPPSQAVVVVSSDRAVAADAHTQGAVTLSVPEFLQAAGR